MGSVTYFSNGTIRLSTGDDIAYARLDSNDIKEMIDYLTGKGYIVIDAKHAEYCRYVSGECPRCGRPAERPSP